jgi:hypothetical protein
VPAAFHRGDVNAVITIRTIIRAKNGVRSLCVFESLGDIGRGDGPGIAWLVAACAGTAILPEILKKRSGEIDFPGRAERLNLSGRILKGKQIRKKSVIRQRDRPGPN